MKIYTKTFLVLLLLAFSVTGAFAQQDGKTPPKKNEGKPPVVKVEDKNDREQKERPKQEKENKKPQ